MKTSAEKTYHHTQLFNKSRLRFILEHIRPGNTYTFTILEKNLIEK